MCTRRIEDCYFPSCYSHPQANKMTDRRTNRDEVSGKLKTTLYSCSEWRKFALLVIENGQLRRDLLC